MYRKVGNKMKKLSDYFKKKVKAIDENDEIELRMDELNQADAYPENYVTQAVIYYFDRIVTVAFDGKNTNIKLIDGTMISYNDDTDMMNFKYIMQKMKETNIEFFSSYQCENRTMTDHEISEILMNEGEL